MGEGGKEIDYCWRIWRHLDVNVVIDYREEVMRERDNGVVFAALYCT